MPTAPQTILIVDDNDLMRTLLRGILRSDAYLVIGEARNGIVALDLIEKSKPDIVFLDVMMPEMGGLEALQAIKAKHPEISSCSSIRCRAAPGSRASGRGAGRQQQR